MTMRESVATSRRVQCDAQRTANSGRAGSSAPPRDTPVTAVGQARFAVSMSRSRLSAIDSDAARSRSYSTS